MNTREQAAKIHSDINDLMEPNKGELEFTFFKGEPKKLKILNLHSFTNSAGFFGTVTTFTNNIKSTTVYDLYQIKKVTGKKAASI